jgi:hypothetical protein
VDKHQQRAFQQDCKRIQLFLPLGRMPPTLTIVLVVNLLLVGIAATMIAVGKNTEASIDLMSLYGEALFTPRIERLTEQGYNCIARGTYIPAGGGYATEMCSRAYIGGPVTLVEVYFKYGAHCDTLLVPRPHTLRAGDLMLLWGDPQQGARKRLQWWVEYGTPVYTPYFLNYERYVRYIHFAGQTPC